MADEREVSVRLWMERTWVHGRVSASNLAQVREVGRGAQTSRCAAWMESVVKQHGQQWPETHATEQKPSAWWWLLAIEGVSVWAWCFGQREAGDRLGQAGGLQKGQQRLTETREIGQ
jgi:hypothetical protein